MRTIFLLLTLVLSLSSTVFGEHSIEQYVIQLKKLSETVVNSSEADMGFQVQVSAGEPKIGSRNEASVLRLVTDSNEALELFLEEIVPASSNFNTQPKLRALLQKMKRLELYVIGEQNLAHGYEVSEWILMGHLNGKIITLKHNRVFT